MECLAERPCHEGHDGVLGDGADEYVEGPLQEDDEVLGAEGASHGEHDESEDYAGPLSLLNPCEGFGDEEGEYGNGYDEG